MNLCGGKSYSIGMGIVHMSKFKAGKVEKNSSTIGPPAGIKPAPLRCRSQFEF